jgi:hypothetical protein
MNVDAMATVMPFGEDNKKNNNNNAGVRVGEGRV